MIGYLKSGRNQFFDSFYAFFQVKDRMAFLAEKVVVMPFVRAFVTGCLSWNFNTTNQPFLLEGFKRSVDGSDPKGGDIL